MLSLQEDEVREAEQGWLGGSLSSSLRTTPRTSPLPASLTFSAVSLFGPWRCNGSGHHVSTTDGWAGE